MRICCVCGGSGNRLAKPPKTFAKCLLCLGLGTIKGRFMLPAEPLNNHIKISQSQQKAVNRGLTVKMV
jgi:hypothetical protein